MTKVPLEAIDAGENASWTWIYISRGILMSVIMSFHTARNSLKVRGSCSLFGKIFAFTVYGCVGVLSSRFKRVVVLPMLSLFSSVRESVVALTSNGARRPVSWLGGNNNDGKKKEKSFFLSCPRAKEPPKNDPAKRMEDIFGKAATPRLASSAPAAKQDPII